MATPFTKALKDARQKNLTYHLASASHRWFRLKVSKALRGSLEDLDHLAENSAYVEYVNRPKIGHMYTYLYDPKLKKTLPYYDRLPLIFVVDLYANGFLGINLHYLPRKFRAIFMDALFTIMSDHKMTETTRLKISYEVLKQYTRKFKYFRPCLKRYLYTHVCTDFLRIDVMEWDRALMLPMERFQKESKEVVWMDSARSLGLKY